MKLLLLKETTLFLFCFGLVLEKTSNDITAGNGRIIKFRIIIRVRIGLFHRKKTKFYIIEIIYGAVV